jgi:glycosyltransferase involved in cell wall biosynthesis
MSENCRARAEELSWENKAKQVVKLYESILSHKK